MVNAIAQVPFFFTADLPKQIIWFVSIVISCAIGTYVANRFKDKPLLLLEPLVEALEKRQDAHAKQFTEIRRDILDICTQLRNLKIESSTWKNVIDELSLEKAVAQGVSAKSSTHVARNDSEMMQRQNTLDKEIDVLMSEYKKTNELIPTLVKQCNERLIQQDYRVQSRMDIMDNRVTHTLENCKKLMLMMEKQNKRKRAPRSKTQTDREAHV